LDKKKDIGGLLFVTTAKTSLQFFSLHLGRGENPSIPGDAPCSISEPLFPILSLFTVFVSKGNEKEERYKRKTLNFKPKFQAHNSTTLTI